VRDSGSLGRKIVKAKEFQTLTCSYRVSPFNPLSRPLKARDSYIYIYIYLTFQISLNYMLPLRKNYSDKQTRFSLKIRFDRVQYVI
jgi:hypothetical protein